LSIGDEWHIETRFYPLIYDIHVARWSGGCVLCGSTPIRAGKGLTNQINWCGPRLVKKALNGSLSQNLVRYHTRYPSLVSVGLMAGNNGLLDCFTRPRGRVMAQSKSYRCCFWDISAESASQIQLVLVY